MMAAPPRNRIRIPKALVSLSSPRRSTRIMDVSEIYPAGKYIDTGHCTLLCKFTHTGHCILLCKYEGVSKTFWTDAAKIINLSTKRV
jgi:hypothetical protein